MPPRTYSHHDNTSNRSSSIDTWLDGHPELPGSYESVNPPPTNSKKRSRAAPRARVRGGSQAGRKYRKLQGISGNVMPANPEKYEQELKEGLDPQGNIPQRRSARRNAGRQGKTLVEASANKSSTSKPSATPRKSRPGHSSVNDEDPCDEDFYDADLPDEDLTPRGPSSAIIPNLKPPHFEPPASVDRSSTRSSQSGNARSTSPTKMARFQLSSIRVKMITDGQIPTRGEDLWHSLKRIGFGKKVMPMIVKERAVLGSDDPEDADRQFDPAVTGKGEKIGNDGFDHEETWIRVGEIYRAALKCRDKRFAEPAWNSDVHSRLLRLALGGYWELKGIGFRDVTTARINDKSLVDINMPSKMVDYVIVIEPDPGLETKILEKIKAMIHITESINHSDAEYLCFDPIAISMETKRAAINEDKGDVQLSVWIKAHYAKLRQLAPQIPANELPVLPIMTALGHSWTFMLAEMFAGDQVIIHRELSLGATSSMLGIYQLLAAVRRLARWVHEDYKAWFIEKVLN